MTDRSDVVAAGGPMAGSGPVEGGADPLPTGREDVARRRAAVVAALVGAVAAETEILLVAHVNPDGDSLGSALALGLAVRSLGGRPRVTFDSEPFAVPRTLRFLAGQELLADPASVVGRPGLVICLDAASRPRLGRLGRLTEPHGVGQAGGDPSVPGVVVIDHHASNTRFGELNLVDRDAPSTSAMVVDLIDALGVALDADMAAAIYTGLVTDTGSFRFAATTPAVHALAARLLATGIRHDLISQALWDTHRFGYVKLLGTVLGRARLEPEHDLVWSWCGESDLRVAGLDYDEIEGFIDTLRTVSEAEVALICKQDGTAWKASVRSRGGVDVGALCSGLGGGGHQLAAGFTARMELAPLMDRVRAALAHTPRLTDPRARVLAGPDDAAGRTTAPAAPASRPAQALGAR
jgi:phosphoesterase RecJ-like protein